jgi:hypothetical protein
VDEMFEDGERNGLDAPWRGVILRVVAKLVRKAEVDGAVAV